MNNIKVSAIMPSLNVRDYIRESVCSILKQSLREIEVICIDAGSDDGTWEILTELATTDERIILRHSDVRSYGHQMNVGIRMARGEYISIVETDDYISEDMYENLYVVAKKNNCDYVKSDFYSYWTQQDGKRFFVRRKSFSNNSIYNSVIVPREHPEIAGGDWYLWSGIYKREFIIDNNIGFAETKGAAFQDIGFLFQTTSKANRAIYVPDAYYNYCIDRDSASSNVGKGLLFATEEYRRLLALFGKLNDMKREMASMLYVRMAESFVCSYNEFENRDVVISDEDRLDCYNFFNSLLNEAVSQGIVKQEYMPSGMWYKLLILLESERNYFEMIDEKLIRIKSVIGETGSYPIVVFGCGAYGYATYKWLAKRGYSIAYYMDNNKELWEQEINGIRIVSPEHVKTSDEPLKFIIASLMYSIDIKNQLLDMGVSEADICIYT